MAKQFYLYATRGYATAGVTATPADIFTGASPVLWKTLYTATSDDAVVKGLAATSSDTAAINLKIGIDVAGSGTVRVIACVNVPIAAGTGGTVHAVDLLNAAACPFLPVDRTGKRVLPLKAGDVLKVSPVLTMTAGTLTVTALAEEY